MNRRQLQKLGVPPKFAAAAIDALRHAATQDLGFGLKGSRESLAPGMRIRIAGEDRPLTVNSNSPTSNSPASASARSTATAVE